MAGGVFLPFGPGLQVRVVLLIRSIRGEELVASHDLQRHRQIELCAV
jgi:hypothetical protein